MSVEVTKIFTTTCYGELFDEIVNTAAITATLENIMSDGGSSTIFVFDDVLSAPAEAALDLLLISWACPIEATVDYSLGNDDAITSEPNVGDHIIWDGNNWIATEDTGSSVASPLPSLQVRRTTAYTDIPVTWADVAFDTTDLENDNTILEHDDSNADRILVKEDGLYMVQYNFTVDDEAMGRVRIDDTTAIDGSEKEGGALGDVNDTNQLIHNAFFVNLTAGEYLTLQIQARSTAESMLAGATFTATKMQGAKGDTGPAGSGTTVVLQEGGTDVTNTPHTTINFDGTDFDVTDNGDGSATITSNASAGPVFGTEYQSASSESESTTTSTSFQNKLNMTTPSLPAGTYRIGYSYEWNLSGSTRYDFRGRVQINDTVTISEHREEPQDSATDQWRDFSGFFHHTGSGVLSIDIDYERSSSSGGTARIRRARLEIWRVE